MNPLERLHDIETRLDSGTLGIDEACAALFIGPKPWHTPWWKEQRSTHIGPACATCGSSNPPLVLQHTWQPVRWAVALRVVGPPNWDWWKEQHPLPDLNQPDLNQLVDLRVTLPVCPQCGSHQVRRRVRTKDWVCHVGQCGAPHQRHADFAFPEPKFELRQDPKALREHKRTIRQKYLALSQARWEAWLKSPEAEENRLRALRLCIEESKRYLSFADTKTLCRPCAGREDVEHIRRGERAKTRRKEANPDWSEFEEHERFAEGLDTGNGDPSGS